MYVFLQLELARGDADHLNIAGGIYARGYKPFEEQVPVSPLGAGPSARVGVTHRPLNPQVESLTHILYSFANIKPGSGEVHLTDAWADEQVRAS